MKKNLLPFCLGFAIFTSSFICLPASAQKAPHGEMLEQLLSYWSASMEEVRAEQGASPQDLAVFNRFYYHEIDSMQILFNNGIFGGTINLSNVKDYMADKKIEFTRLFKKFVDIEREYPSSVEEYRFYRPFKPGGDSCFPSCYNTGFQDGTFDGWYGYYGKNSSTTTAFNITGVTGGYLGPVVKAAQDPLTGNTYQMRITSGTTTDAFLNTYSTYSMPEVSPYAGNYSVMLGDSTRDGQGVAILSQSFIVTSSTASITYQYALFLENPITPRHTYWQQPFFTVNVIDNVTGDTIPGCGTYHQDALVGETTPGFKGIYYPTNSDTVYWKNWSIASVPLKDFVGHCVTVVFQIQDCSLGAHFGYAYVAASCVPNQVIASSPALCGQDSIALTAPPGYTNYLWSGNPSTGIISNDTLQTIYVNAAGVYTVEVKNLTGGVCADTLTIVVDSAPGPVPTPSFHANTVCAGQNTTFINTSNPITGQFYWDFYNIGTYQDTLITNPTWIYSTPGTYVVKLHEVNNGCGADFFDTIQVDSTVNGVFSSANNGCAPSTVTFTNGSTGASTYFWNYGDTASHTLDTSSASSGTHLYNTPGTYTVTMIASNGGPCPDTIRQTVTILGPPVALITGGDSVCAGSTDTLTASGGTSYLWSTAQTTSSINVSPAVQTVYSVTVSNACGSADTTFTVSIAVAPVATASANKDSICSGDTATLTATGGGTYHWSNGATGSTIKVTPNSSTSYTVTVFRTGTNCSDTASVNINVTPKIVSSVIPAGGDSVCLGGNTTLTVNSSSGNPTYTWSNGATTSAITISPLTDTTYTVVVSGKCADTTLTEKITVTPSPTIAIIGGDSVCAGTTDTLKVTGAGNGSTYLWSNSKTTSSINVTPTVQTVYSVSVTNACGVFTASFTVNIAAPPVATISASPDTVCKGDSVLLTAGGGGSFLWSNGATTSSIKVAPSSNTSYSVTVFRTGTTCEDTISKYITVTNKITSSLVLTGDSLCPGGTANLSVSSAGGSPTYLWSNGTTTSSISVSPGSTTLYSVVVTGPCADTTITQTVTVIPYPVISISAPDSVCNGSSVLVSASGATKYVWSNGSTSSSNSVTVNGDTTISVIGSNGNCYDTAKRRIGIISGLKSVGHSDSVCAGSNDIISVSVKGGNAVYTYSWNNGITWDSAGPLTVSVPPTQYLCYIKDGCNYAITDTVNITLHPNPKALFVPTPDTILGGQFVNFVNFTGGNTSYYWNLGDGTNSSDTAPFHEYSQAGVYRVLLTATNSYGCIDTISKDVYVTETIVVPNVFTPNGDGVNDVFHVTAGSLKDYDLQIFNRWGQKIFESQSPSIDWTGRSSSGQMESDGTYYYVLSATDYNNKNFKLDGFVQLIR